MNDIVARARALVGCRYRPQGRDPDFGLDCVGAVCRVFNISDNDVPGNYRLRSDDFETAATVIGHHFARCADSRAGDLLLLRPAPDQLHLAIVTDRGFVHADAGLRRVVETPGEPVWPVIARFRHRNFLTD